MRRIALAFLLIAGCDRGHDHPHPHEEAEPEDLQVTVWGDRFEIFMEHPPLVAGKAARFVTHVSDWTSGRPRTEGPVRFELRPASGAPVIHVEPAPKRAGIYLPELTIPAGGSWTLTLGIPEGGVDHRVELPHFDVGGGEPHDHDHAEAPEGIAFLKEQQWKIGMISGPATKRRMIQRLRLPAEVEPRTGSRAVVTPPIAGRLAAPAGKTLPGIGDAVEAGQVLALLYPPLSDISARLAEADAAVARTRLTLQLAEQTLARVEKLAAAQAKTERERLEAEFALKVAKVEHDAALAVRAAYEKAGAVSVAGSPPALELRAPIAGILVEAVAVEGEQVPSDRPVFAILDPRRVFIEARVPESDLGRVSASKEALYETSEARGRFVPILGDRGGRFVHLGLEVDPVTRTVPLIYEAANPEGLLRIHMALTLHVETDRAEEALAIPVTAVVEEEGRPIAFVHAAGETFERRDLVLGIRDAGFVQVIDGISAGERVVTKGAYSVRLASVATSIPAHSHDH